MEIQLFAVEHAFTKRLVKKKKNVPSHHEEIYLTYADKPTI